MTSPIVSDTRQLDLPLGGGADEALAERAKAIVASLGDGVANTEELFAAFEELDAMPPDVVRSALLPFTGPAPDPERLDAATRAAHGFPPQRLRLVRVAVARDADVLDLGSVAEEQLRIAGKSWDDRDLDPHERLDGESPGSFAGTLERHVLADADQPQASPLFDVLLYADEAGVVFRAGTTELVGAIAYGKVEMSDRRARAAIQEVLSTPLALAPAVTVKEERSVPAREEAVSAPLRAEVGARKAAAERKSKVTERARPETTAAAEGEALALGGQATVVKAAASRAGKEAAAAAPAARKGSPAAKNESRRMGKELAAASSAAKKASPAAKKASSAAKKASSAAKKASSAAKKASSAAKKVSPAAKKASAAAKKASPAAKKASAAAKKASPAAKKASPAAKKASSAAKKASSAAKKVSPAAKKASSAAKKVSPAAKKASDKAPAKTAGSKKAATKVPAAKRTARKVAGAKTMAARSPRGNRARTKKTVK